MFIYLCVHLRVLLCNLQMVTKRFIKLSHRSFTGLRISAVTGVSFLKRLLQIPIYQGLDYWISTKCREGTVVCVNNFKCSVG